MKTLLLVCVLGSLTGSSPESLQGQAAGAVAQPADKAQLHAASVELVEVSGAKRHMQDGLPAMVEAGKKAMLTQYPSTKPEFADEWAKRMQARLDLDAFIAVFVDEYEKYFTLPELRELIAVTKAAQTTSPIAPSQALKTKIQTVMPDLMSEMNGRCVQIASKLGGQIGEELDKEHPEWSPKLDKPALPTPEMISPIIPPVKK